MIVLWGNAHDPPLVAVARSLARRGTSFVFIGETATVARPWSPDAEAVLRVSGREFSLDDVTAAYLRPATEAAGLTDPRGIASTLLAWADTTTTALVVNRPRAMAPNMSKPLQARLLADLGVAVPETLITTDADAVRAFVERHGEVVYKSVSGTRSIVRRLAPSRLDELGDVANCPTQFQRYVAGADWRVHVIGQQVQAISIRSDADDYRYPSGGRAYAEVREVQPSGQLVHEFVRVSAAMGLAFSGIDLRRTAAGEIVYLEVNPAPGFTYYERLAGVDIAGRVAALLEDGPSVAGP